MNCAKVLHIITTLRVGGAQTALIRVLKGTRQVHRNFVVALGEETRLATEIRAICDAVWCLNIGANVHSGLRGILDLRSVIREVRPDIVQTWMHHADLLGGIAASSMKVGRVIWGIRHSDLDPAITKRTTLAVARCCAFLSNRIPERIVCCSSASIQSHTRMGYDSSRMVLIRNGFDCDYFKPDLEMRARTRSALGIDNARVFACFARYHAMKGHRDLLEAFVASGDRPATLLLAGTGVTPGNDELVSDIARLGLRDRVHLLGERPSLLDLYNASDCLVMPSRSGEGFPNVVGEAMSCGVPCIVTDVGDAKEIVGNTGWCVNAGSIVGLGSAMREAAECPSEAMIARGFKARERILDRFSLQCMVDMFKEIYAGDV